MQPDHAVTGQQAEPLEDVNDETPGGRGVAPRSAARHSDSVGSSGEGPQVPSLSSGPAFPSSVFLAFLAFRQNPFNTHLYRLPGFFLKSGLFEQAS